MDNSLFTYQDKVREMKGLFVQFRDNLKYHVIVFPKEYIDDAIRCGCPSDIMKKYLEKYFCKNVADAEEIMEYIEKDCIPYLDDVEQNIGEAIGVGTSYTTIGGRMGNKPNDKKNEQLGQFLAHNDKALEQALKIKRGLPMTIAEADKQNANPNYKPKYIEDVNGEYVYYDGKIRPRKWWFNFVPGIKEIVDTLPRYKENPDYKKEYHINCATCAIAYALRLRGFDVKAKGNTEGTLNNSVSRMGIKYFDLWKNADGTKAEPTTLLSWANKHNIDSLDARTYRQFFEETCKDKGVYIVTVGWENGGGHATILQREDDGMLYFVEPQVYESKYTMADGKRPLADLVDRRALVRKPYGQYGVMRVDDKIFDVAYASLFDVN